MSYGFEWVPAVALVGAFVILMVPAFALIGLVVVALAAVAALAVLAGAIIASPYLLARTLHRYLASSPGRRSAEEIRPDRGRPAWGRA
jgi:hypothetical protein